MGGSFTNSAQQDRIIALLEKIEEHSKANNPNNPNHPQHPANAQQYNAQQYHEKFGGLGQITTGELPGFSFATSQIQNIDPLSRGVSQAQQKFFLDQQFVQMSRSSMVDAPNSGLRQSVDRLQYMGGTVGNDATVLPNLSKEIAAALAQTATRFGGPNQSMSDIYGRADKLAVSAAALGVDYQQYNQFAGIMNRAGVMGGQPGLTAGFKEDAGSFALTFAKELERGKLWDRLGDVMQTMAGLTQQVVQRGGAADPTNTLNALARVTNQSYATNDPRMREMAPQIFGQVDAGAQNLMNNGMFIAMAANSDRYKGKSFLKATAEMTEALEGGNTTEKFGLMGDLFEQFAGKDRLKQFTKVGDLSQLQDQDILAMRQIQSAMGMNQSQAQAALVMANTLQNSGAGNEASNVAFSALQQNKNFQNLNMANQIQAVRFGMASDDATARNMVTSLSESMGPSAGKKLQEDINAQLGKDFKSASKDEITEAYMKASQAKDAPRAGVDTPAGDLAASVKKNQDALDKFADAVMGATRRILNVGTTLVTPVVTPERAKAASDAIGGVLSPETIENTAGLTQLGGVGLLALGTFAVARRTPGAVLSGVKNIYGGIKTAGKNVINRGRGGGGGGTGPHSPAPSHSPLTGGGSARSSGASSQYTPSPAVATPHAGGQLFVPHPTGNAPELTTHRVGRAPSTPSAPSHGSSGITHGGGPHGGGMATTLATVGVTLLGGYLASGGTRTASAAPLEEGGETSAASIPPQHTVAKGAATPKTGASDESTTQDLVSDAMLAQDVIRASKDATSLVKAARAARAARTTAQVVQGGAEAAQTANIVASGGRVLSAGAKFGASEVLGGLFLANDVYNTFADKPLMEGQEKPSTMRWLFGAAGALTAGIAVGGTTAGLGAVPAALAGYGAGTALYDAGSAVLDKAGHWWDQAKEKMGNVLGGGAKDTIETATLLADASVIDTMVVQKLIIQGGLTGGATSPISAQAPSTLVEPAKRGFVETIAGSTAAVATATSDGTVYSQGKTIVSLPAAPVSNANAQTIAATDRTGQVVKNLLVDPKTGKTVDATITSSFYDPRGGGIHAAYDVAVNGDTSGYGVVSLTDATVSATGSNKELGNYVTMRLGGSGKDAVYVTYDHLEDQPGYKTGDTVRRGEVVGKVGHTGTGAGPNSHLHMVGTLGGAPGEGGRAFDVVGALAEAVDATPGSLANPANPALSSAVSEATQKARSVILASNSRALNSPTDASSAGAATKMEFTINVKADEKGLLKALVEASASNTVKANIADGVIKFSIDPMVVSGGKS